MPKAVNEDVMRSWAEAQRHLWDGWLAALGQAGTGLPTATGAKAPDMLARLIDTWEPFVRQTLDAQAAAMQSALDGLSQASNVPEQLRPQLQQVHELTRGLTDTQRQMWGAMFAAGRQFAASSGGQQPHAPQVPNLELWQQLAKPAMDAQATWLRTWSGLLGGGRGPQPDK